MKYLILLLAAVAVASAFNEEFWVKKGVASPSARHSVLIGVKLREGAAADCDSALMDISDPKSPNYGKHWSFNAVASFSDRKHFMAVMRWAIDNGLTPKEIKPSPNMEFVRVTTTVEKLNRLFNVELAEYSSVEDSSVSVYRATDFKIQHLNEMAAHIDFVSDFHTLPVSTAQRARVTSHGVAAEGQASPSLLSSTYNIGNRVVTNSGATQALFESLGQSYDPTDLKNFQQQFNLQSTSVSKTIGNNNPGSCAGGNFNACGEASLDVQWMLAVAENSTTWYWSIPGNGDIFLIWIEAVSSMSNAPLVHSVSYGSLAPEDPATDIERFDTDVCKLGLRGFSIMVATGDDGVANFQARNNPSACGFTPSFPATSRYVTAVGATQGPEFGKPEVACASNTGGLITTGGGFSTLLKRPSYQEAAVSGYLKNGPNLPPPSKFNTLGRAYPDVALLGHNYPVIVGGREIPVSGTSASTPVFAALVTLVNDARLNAGKSAVGFLNPAIYQMGASGGVFNDVTKGENNCAAGQPGNIVCCQYGFTATTGWDPVTGWGSPNFEKFKGGLMSF